MSANKGEGGDRLVGWSEVVGWLVRGGWLVSQKGFHLERRAFWIDLLGLMIQKVEIRGYRTSKSRVFNSSWVKLSIRI